MAQTTTVETITITRPLKVSILVVLLQNNLLLKNVFNQIKNINSLS